MDPQDLLLTALRASLIYFFLLIVVRLLGKREVGNASAFDLIVALMLGEVVDEAIYGDVSMAKGLLAIGVIAAWHLINSYASYRSKRIQTLTGGKPTVIVEDGQIKQDALAKERMHQDEVYAEMRMLGVDDIAEVKIATLEPNGQVSVLLEDWAKPIQKQDVFEGKQKEAEKTLKANKQDIEKENWMIQHPELAANEDDQKVKHESARQGSARQGSRGQKSERQSARQAGRKVERETAHAQAKVRSSEQRRSERSTSEQRNYEQRQREKAQAAKKDSENEKG